MALKKYFKNQMRIKRFYQEQLLKHFDAGPDKKISFKEAVTKTVEFFDGSKAEVLLTKQFHPQISSEDAKAKFGRLYCLLAETARHHKIPFKAKDIVITTVLLDDKRFIPSVCGKIFGSLNKDNYEPGFINIHSGDVRNRFIFLRELAYFCLDIDIQNVTPRNEFLYNAWADLLALITMKRIMPDHRREYREALESTYVCKYGKDFLEDEEGDTDPDFVLKNPEVFLRGCLDATAENVISDESNVPPEGSPPC